MESVGEPVKRQIRMDAKYSPDDVRRQGDFIKGRQRWGGKVHEQGDNVCKYYRHYGDVDENVNKGEFLHRRTFSD